MIKPVIIRIILILSVSVIISSCWSVAYSNADSRELAKPAELPASMFTSKSQEDWAQIQITENMTVLRFDNYQVNWWGFKEYHFIPTGRHKIVFLPSGYQDAGSIEYYFSPGLRYILRTVERTSDTARSGNAETTRYTARPEIVEQGVTEYAVPAKNYSIVEFTLNGERAMVHINEKHYVISTLSSQEGNTLRLFLPNGTHNVSVAGIEIFKDTGDGDSQSITLQDKFVSYIITPSYKLIKQIEQPLKLTGKWKIDVLGDGSIVYLYSFRPNNTGYAAIYDNGVIDKSSGNFEYTITNETITMLDSGGKISMNYILNGDELKLINFLGQPLTVIGSRQ